MPVCALRVSAILEEDDALGAAELGDPLDVEGDVPADVDDPGRLGTVLVDRALEVGEGDAEVLAVAVEPHGLAAGRERGERRRHERVRRAEDLLAAHAGPVERGHGAACPAPGRDRVATVPPRPGPLEAVDHAPLGPPARVEHLVPERVEPRAVARVPTDPELLPVLRHDVSPASRGTGRSRGWMNDR